MGVDIDNDEVCGIYKITCAANNKSYIGSSKNITKRWNVHKQSLNSNSHHNPHLQKAWNKYGSDKFVFSILEECDVNDLLCREKYWIEYFNCYSSGYNIAKIVKIDNSLIQESRYKFNESLPIELVKTIKHELCLGNTTQYICNKYSVSYQQVNNIRTLQTYSEVSEENNTMIFNTSKYTNYYDRINSLMDGRSVGITKRELDFLDLYKKNEARGLFTLLCLAKCRNVLSGTTENIVTLPLSNIWLNAAITNEGIKQALLCNENIVVNSDNVEILFVDNDTSGVVCSSDFRLLGMRYRMLKDENVKIKECYVCGLLINCKTHNRKYCKTCGVSVKRQKDLIRMRKTRGER